MDEGPRLLPATRPFGLATTWAVALVVVAVTAVLLVPPGPSPVDAPDDSFAAERALVLLRDLARAPRPSGSAENARVREDLVDTLEGLGLEPRLQTVRVPDWYDPSGAEVDVVNVLARIPGEDPTGTIALVAHYDTTPMTPGANDDGAGVAAVLETARAVLAAGAVRNDVLLLLTDGEEPAPRFGSSAFVAEHPWAEDVALVLNLEAAGCCGPSLLVETSGESTWLVDELVATDRRPAAYSLLTGFAALLGGAGSDIDPFRDTGVPGSSVAYLDGSPIYHTPADTIDTVSPRSLQHTGDHALSFVRRAGQLDLASVPDPEGGLAYVSIGPAVLRYGGAWRFPVLLLVLVVVALALARIAPSIQRPVRTTVVGAVVSLVAALVAGVVTALLWAAVVAAGASPGPVGSRVLLAVVLGIAGALWWTTARVLASRTAVPDVTGGLLLLWLLLAVAATLVFPGAGPWFAWPLLAAGTVVAWRGGPRSRRWPIVAARAAVVAVATAIVSVPAVDVLWQLAQPRPGNPDSPLTGLAGVVAVLAVLSGALVVAASSARAVGRLTPLGEESAGPATGASAFESVIGARVGIAVGVLLGGLVGLVSGVSAGAPLVALLVAGAVVGAGLGVRRAAAEAAEDPGRTRRA